MKTKKELKEDYKQMKFVIGVFQITNTANGKIYIEGSTNVTARWNRYITQLNFGSLPILDLQNDWKVFGEEKFSFEILSEIKQDDSKEIDYAKEVKDLEEMFIEDLQPFGEKGYNKRKWWFFTEETLILILMDSTKINLIFAV